MEDTTKFEEMPMQAAPLFSFDSPKGQSSYIKVIGVGGGGGNAVNHMFREGIAGVDFIVCNTDMKALGASPVPNKIPLGNLGLGAGGKPEKARKAAEDKRAIIEEALSHNTQMLFITAGMGGGTGTGAAPVIAEIAKSIKLDTDENDEILVVAIVTRPFTFEGRKRMEQAEAGIQALRDKVDSIIIIDNDKLFAFGDLTMSQAYAMADDVLLTAAKGIAEIISKEGYICRDFQDINSVMEHSGRALMGTGSGRGENRAKDAINAATKSVLLDDSDINGAKNVLLYFTSSHEHEMTIREQMEITDYVCQATGGFADVKYGAGYDDELGDELKVTLIATGFDKVEKYCTTETQDSLSDKPQETPAENPSEPHFKQPTQDSPTDSQEKKTDPNHSGKVVRTLEDNMEPAKKPTDKTEESTDSGDSMVDGIHIVPASNTKPAETTDTSTTTNTVEDNVEVKPEPTPAPAPKPDAEVTTLIKNALHNDIGTLNASERIRKIHELLHFDPVGPDKVFAMTTEQIANGEVVEMATLPHSSTREASTYTIQANGKMTSVPTCQAKTD